MKYIIGRKTSSVFLTLFFFIATAIVVVPSDAAAQVGYCLSGRAGDYTADVCPGQAPTYKDAQGNIIDEVDVSEEARQEAAVLLLMSDVLGGVRANAADSDAKHRAKIDEGLDTAKQQLWAGDYKKALKSVKKAKKRIRKKLATTDRTYKLALAMEGMVYRGTGQHKKADAVREESNKLFKVPLRLALEVADENGAMLQPKTGAIFPAEAGNFGRESLHAYNDEGTDVSANYELLEGSYSGRATLYVTTGLGIDKTTYLRISERDMAAANPWAQPFEDAPITAKTSQGEQHGHYARYRDGKKGKRYTGVYVFEPVPDVMVKFRLTYEGKYKDAFTESFHALMQAMTWPGDQVAEQPAE